MNRPSTLPLAALLCASLWALPASAQKHLGPRPAAHAPSPPSSPCSLLPMDQILAVIGPGVQGGKPGATDCAWSDSKGQSRVYLSLSDAKDFHSLRSSMQSTGRLVPITGVGEDAFFVSSRGSSAALYTLKGTHVLLLAVTGPDFSKAQNEAAEKALAPGILSKL